MNITPAYKIHTLEKILPIVIPKNIITIDQLFNEYGIKKTEDRPANSLVCQFASLVFQGTNNGTTSVKDTTNTSRSVGYSSSTTAYGAASSYRGIILGTGDTAVTLSDYALGTRIDHGSAAGNLWYQETVGATSFLPVTSGSSNSWSILKPITNLDTSNLTVKEAAIYLQIGSYVHMIERTVLSPTYTFVAKSSVVMEYISTITI